MNCNNYFDMTDQGDSFESWQGLRGPAGPQGTPGAPGSSVELKGPVATTGDLPATAPSGELWQVGTQAPYNGYFFNGEAWVNLGPVAAGATFTPTVSSDGVISWTNDGGLPNPESVNIKGPQGATGPQGPQGETGATGATGPQGETGPAGPGVPSGGTTRQVLKKMSVADYNTAWQDDDLYITGASVGDLVRISAVGENGKPTVFGRISDPNTNVGIVQNGNNATQNITKGQYVIWKGALYTASAAIASGTTLSDSNLTAVTGGGLNQFLARSQQGRIAASSSVEITLEKDSNGIAIFPSVNDGYKDIVIFRCTDQGSISIKSMFNTTIAFSTSGSKLTITNPSPASVLPYFIMYW